MKNTLNTLRCKGCSKFKNMKRGITMAVSILIPTALRQFTDNLSEVEVENSETVNQALEALVTKYIDLKRHLFTEEGILRSFVNIYIGEEDIRQLNGVDTALKEGETLILVPSIAGGI